MFLPKIQRKTMVLARNRKIVSVFIYSRSDFRLSETLARQDSIFVIWSNAKDSWHRPFLYLFFAWNHPVFQGWFSGINALLLLWDCHRSLNYWNPACNKDLRMKLLIVSPDLDIAKVNFCETLIQPTFSRLASRVDNIFCTPRPEKTKSIAVYHWAWSNA